jgi:aspartate carbamoyltransferase catalytic subunit
VSLCGRSLVSLSDLSLLEVVTILDAADLMATAIGFDDPSTRAIARPLDRILASLFFEPSTRTRLSFDSAMLRLGGQVLGFADPAVSSAKKGESLADTIRMAAAYSDVIVIRHPLAGAAKVAADVSCVPVINAGDGAREHPTQTLTDLFCIRRELGTLSGLKVGLCGDLKYGRTVHSFAPMMARFGSECLCIAPEELRMPAEILDEVEALGGIRPREMDTLEAALPELDVLYMTRVQRERFESEADFARVGGCFVLTPECMALAGPDMIVLHPLPRVDEIATTVDDDPRAQYFRQAAGGVPVRMALISLLLGTDKTSNSRGSFRFEHGTPAAASVEPAAPVCAKPAVATDRPCPNRKCITSTETYLQPLVTETAHGVVCAYCEEKAG